MANECDSSRNFCIIVHAGAGYHSKQKEILYNEACNKACLEASNLFKEKSSTAMDVAVKAVQILEESAVTNAGFGSNLTLNNEVECDASVMCGKTGIFGSVGALSGILNPVTVAHLLYKQQVLYPSLSLGRIPPMTLVGSGAYQWAVSQGVTSCPPHSLISEGSLKYHSQCMKQLAKAEMTSNSRMAKRQKLTDSPDICAPLDTVGAVCIDPFGDIAVAISSGGIACKQSGRLGQASLYGYGCWTETKQEASIGLASTGTGEQLIKTRFAIKCAQSLIDCDDIFDVVYNSFNSDFLSSPLLSQSQKKNAGIIALKQSNLKSPIVETLYAHTTHSMSISYFSSQMKQPESFISRQKSVSDDPVVIGGVAIKFA